MSECIDVFERPNTEQQAQQQTNENSWLELVVEANMLKFISYKQICCGEA